MKIPDEEISNNVSAKMTHWNKSISDKVARWIKEGNISDTDLIFLLENQRADSSEVKYEN